MEPPFNVWVDRNRARIDEITVELGDRAVVIRGRQEALRVSRGLDELRCSSNPDHRG
jgi:hypothetical protein